MSYLPGGYLRSLEMHDSKGLLDRYIYGYDTQGNRTEIERTRRELKDISGKYTYDYDLEKRLINVRRDGALLRSYAYDAFGNRSIMTDEGVVTKYRYDELDRLLETVSDSKAVSYEYDKRGNIAKEYTDGLLQKTFTFDATNMLSKVVDAESGEATYSYNGMGKRVAVQNPTESIDYLLDLTKDYHNMLERTVNGESETYTYDSNVVSMSKSGNDYFYMLDELGTGMYLTGTDGIATSTYAYDEFGRNINPFTGKKEKPAYTKQGNIIQPLAFTGYQHDEMTGSYFAQARYYDAGVGRFVSEDSVRGSINRPDTINHYLYCWNMPTSLRDLNGRDPIDDEFVPQETDYITMDDYVSKRKDEARQNYDNERTEKIGESIDQLQTHYYEGMPDYTEMIDQWLEGQNQEILAAGVYGILGQSICFYNKVKTGGEMDIKNPNSWAEAFNVDYPTEENQYFLYHGVVMDAATLGNVTYAYVGAYYFSDEMLYAGGAAVQVKRNNWRDLPYMFTLPYWGDAPEDHEAIELGLKWNKEGFCDE
jgi:RHS repeat-associated protein